MVQGVFDEAECLCQTELLYSQGVSQWENIAFRVVIVLKVR